MGRRRKAWLWAGTGRQPGRPGYYVRFYDYRAGKRINRTKHFLRAASAREWMRRYNARADLQTLEQVVPISMRDAVAEFLGGLSTRARSTRVHYASACGMLGTLSDHGDVCDIDGAAIDRFIANRLRVSAPATVSKHLRSLHRFFAWSIGRGYAIANPVKAATALPRAAQPRQRPSLTDTQLERLLGVLDTPDRRLAAWLALTTGLDRGVIVRLTSAHVDLAAGVILTTRPKTQRTYSVPIHPLLAPMLADRLSRRPAGTPLLLGLARQNSARDWWKRAVRAAGLPDLWFRDLRAVAASRLQRLAGVGLVDAQHLLGHASPETTARHYYAPDPAIARAFQTLPLPGHRGSAKPKKRKRAPSSRPASRSA